MHYYISVVAEHKDADGEIGEKSNTVGSCDAPLL